MNRYHDLIDRIDGYTVGTLIVTLETRNGEIPLESAASIEVLNGDNYESVTLADCRRISTDGWPLFAGLYARVK